MCGWVHAWACSCCCCCFCFSSLFKKETLLTFLIANYHFGRYIYAIVSTLKYFIILLPQCTTQSGCNHFSSHKNCVSFIGIISKQGPRSNQCQHNYDKSTSGSLQQSNWRPFSYLQQSGVNKRSCLLDVVWSRAWPCVWCTRTAMIFWVFHFQGTTSQCFWVKH